VVASKSVLLNVMSLGVIGALAVYSPSARGMQAEGATARRTVSPWRNPAASVTGAATTPCMAFALTPLPCLWHRIDGFRRRQDAAPDSWAPLPRTAQEQIPISPMTPFWSVVPPWRKLISAETAG